MAVSKRTRFEVLRRDEFRCQYCGLKAEETGEGLTIDHVVPVTLGGPDTPDNLVAACIDCNVGKSSIQPDSPLVKSVSDHAAAYALGMLDRMTTLRAEIQDDQLFAARFRAIWDTWTQGGKPVPLPHDYARSLGRWNRMGVPMDLIDEGIRAAMSKPFIRGEFGEFSYMAGVIWGRINEHEIDYSLSEKTVRTFTKNEVENYGEVQRGEGYEDGFSDGQDFATTILSNQDYVRFVIDGEFDHWAMKRMMPGG